MEMSAMRVGDWVGEGVGVGADGWEVIMRMALQLLKCNILIFSHDR